MNLRDKRTEMAIMVNWTHQAVSQLAKTLMYVRSVSADKVNTTTDVGVDVGVAGPQIEARVPDCSLQRASHSWLFQGNLSHISKIRRIK